MRATVEIVAFVLGLSSAPAWADSELPPKLQPAEAIQQLAESQHADFIVQGAESGLETARKMVTSTNFRPLPFISAVGISLTLKEAVSLAKRADIKQVFYVSSSLYTTYCRIIDAIEYAFKNNPRPSVINLSLGPPADVMPIAGNEDEPMNAATKKASDNGLIIVMAIGNYFDGDNDGIVNPWCAPEWVICVGAASSDATKVWSGSARGLASDPRTWPDMVANGIDVISPWPNIPKPENRRRDDEANPVFQKSVPKERWPIYTIGSGTSQATAQVSRASGQIIAFVLNAAQQKGNVQPGDKLFSITVRKIVWRQPASVGRD